MPVKHLEMIQEVDNDDKSPNGSSAKESPIEREVLEHNRMLIEEDEERKSGPQEIQRANNCPPQYEEEKEHDVSV